MSEFLPTTSEYFPRNPKIGDSGYIIAEISMKNVLNSLGAVSVAEMSFTAGVKLFARMLSKSVTGSKGNPYVFAALTITSVATTAVQYIFDEQLEALDKLFIRIYYEYQMVDYTQQGLTVQIPRWVAVRTKCYLG
ncbi:hypothetical protein [Anaerotignum sp.]|uniref:hypothetical protein n=1 Tax=Anaerotignum sp. TaxID=2039241 RepID=UPI0028B2388B|nr:hypothetical protein [Anaerotignum sp.]